ncbi:uncharacterized protein B0I36DRAFT_368424 [Microdochium trichocladiopsis]|uniref:Uncharacterized protein n=1 Tax=Microdochium trichocladiopsis TaxID=1682393 RepID=A0A9P8XV04_9PEZI|nr:uncharacterized protein B0I36DRAFT_368424 [Microdochium trichocladiopsis]KAH7018401.1 hypothetical protein B0I36DRAFT_368424 [Microdochium trichocladiopsis]
MFNLDELHIIEWLPYNFTGKAEPKECMYWDCKADCDDTDSEADDCSSVEIPEPDDGDLDGELDNNLNEALYTRKPWHLVRQNEMDEHLCWRKKQFGVDWNLTLTLHPEKTQYDQDHYYGSNWDVPLYAHVAERFEMMAGDILASAPEVFYSHILPEQIDLETVRQLTRDEIYGDAELD